MSTEVLPLSALSVSLVFVLANTVKVDDPAHTITPVIYVELFVEVSLREPPKVAILRVDLLVNVDLAFAFTFNIANSALPIMPRIVLRARSR